MLCQYKIVRNVTAICDSGHWIPIFSFVNESVTIVLNSFISLYVPHIKGIFTGPDIRNIRAHDEMFSNALTAVELRAWNCFKDVCDNFLGKRRSEDYNEKIDELIRAYGAMGCIMAPKMHLLQAHRNAFPYRDEVVQLIFFNGFVVFFFIDLGFG